MGEEQEEGGEKGEPPFRRTGSITIRPQPSVAAAKIAMERTREMISRLRKVSKVR